MLNCFYWYTIIWGSVLVLYMFDLSSFNIQLDSGLIFFIISTSLISLVLGYLFRKIFVFNFEDNFDEKNKKIKKQLRNSLIVLTVLYIFEFLYSREIPIISILITKNSKYGEYYGIPLLHVFIVAITSYYSQKFFYQYICTQKFKKYAIFSYIYTLGLFLLCYYRSMIIINLFMSGLMYINYQKTKIKKFGLKKVIIFTTLISIVLYLYGGIGNLRDGYSWNDNSYIENIGLYKRFPKFIPKQYMWTYSYLTTPLANLNYNIKNNNVRNELSGFAGELIPETLTKRILQDKRDNIKVLLIRHYFNAVTGYCTSYITYGYFGMYLLYFWLTVLTMFSLYLVNKINSPRKKTMLYTILIVVYTFMFFYNTLNYVGISLIFWVNICSLFGIKNKKEIGNKNV